MNENEEWRPVRGYEDYYEVSNYGNVRSIPRVTITKRGDIVNRKGKILTLFANKNTGYEQVMLTVHMKYKMCYVHRLVAEAFIDNPHNLRCVVHVNGDKLDNRVENLKWDAYYFQKIWGKVKINELI